MFIAFWIVGKHLKFWNEVLYNQNLNQIALAEPLNSSISARGMYSFLCNLYSSKKKKFEMDNIFHTYCLPNFWQRLLTFQILKERYQSRLPIQLVSILGSAKEVLPSIQKKKIFCSICDKLLLTQLITILKKNTSNPI